MFYDGKQIACHERCRISYHHITLPQHMPPEHWVYKRQSKISCLAWAERIGPHTRAQVTALFESKAHEEQAFRSIKGLQRLAQKYGQWVHDGGLELGKLRRFAPTIPCYFLFQDNLVFHFLQR